MGCDVGLIVCMPTGRFYKKSMSIYEDKIETIMNMSLVKRLMEYVDISKTLEQFR